MRPLLALLATLAVLSPPFLALALEAEGATESVDLSNLQMASITVSFTLPPYYVSSLSEGALSGRCSVLSTASSCAPSIVPEKGLVSFALTEPLSLRVEDLSLGEERTRVTLRADYQPKQFALLSGIGARRRELKVQYPTHMTVVTDVLPRPFSTSFSLSGPPSPLSLRLERATFELGEAIPIPQQDGKLCVAALVRRGATVLSALSVGCAPFALGTDASVGDGEHELYVLVVRKPGIAVAKLPIKLTKPSLMLAAKPSRTVLPLGDEVVVEVASVPPLDGCVVSVLDMNGIRLDTMSLRRCASIPIGTQSAWSPGTYLVLIEGYAGSVKGKATFTLELQGVGYAPAKTRTDKESYVAGEPISVFIDAAGDYCETELFDEENTKVGGCESPGCVAAEIQTDESLTNGSYVLRTKVYSEGDLKAVASRGIDINEWRPPVRSPRAELCRGGYLYVDRYKLPCIAAGDVCIPSSTSVPACLCFGGAGALVGACEYGHRCGAAGCAERVVESAYIIVREAGVCLAKRGLESVSCVELGEVCSGTCVCLDKDSRPISSCALGQVCTFSGCQPLRLDVEVTSGTDHVRSDALEAGTTLATTARITYHESDQREVRLAEPQRAEVRATASLGQLDAEAVDLYYVSPEEGWRISARFAGSLAPGVYESFVIIEYRGDVHVVRRPFEVWYPEAEKDLGVQVARVSPGAMSVASLQKGGTVELVATVAERDGRALAHLAPEAFSVAVGSVAASSVTSTFNEVTGQWTVVATVRNATVQRSESITLSVSSLGRSGSGRERFDVVDQVPLGVRIGRVVPGTKDKPLFYLFATMGFEMDVFVTLEGAPSVRREDVRVRIGTHDVSRDVAYLVSTSEGVRVHLSEVRLCPDPPPPNSQLPVTVGLDVGGRSAEDTVQVTLQGNPGNWRNVKGGSC